MLDIRGVGMRLGDTPVLTDITLHVAQGEFVSILGLNRPGFTGG
jgi:ABC-type cobalamin/Fe3+-siderophores transport system ATPase subunit